MQTASRSNMSLVGGGSQLVPAARFPGTRTLSWYGDHLYASRGYHLLRARVENARNLSWHSVADFHPSWARRVAMANRLSARISRDGFHALAVLPSGAVIAAVAGAIITLGANESEFRVTHRVQRGTRPLHIAAVPGGSVFWGEYFDNSARDEVHIYASTDHGASWNVAYTFPKAAIRHVHNIVYDSWENCLWILTGDLGNECRILRAACDFSRVEVVLQGNQQARAVALVPMPDGLYFSSDTPLEQNHIYRMDRERKLTRLAPVSSSSIHGCCVGERVFFSTMVEPSEVNRDRHVRVYAGCGSEWRPILAWQKDLWPMALFQYGNAFLPDGNNSTPYLAVTTAAVKSQDGVTALYDVNTLPL